MIPKSAVADRAGDLPAQAKHPICMGITKLSKALSISNDLGKRKGGLDLCITQRTTHHHSTQQCPSCGSNSKHKSDCACHRYVVAQLAAENLTNSNSRPYKARAKALVKQWAAEHTNPHTSGTSGAVAEAEAKAVATPRRQRPNNASGRALGGASRDSDDRELMLTGGKMGFQKEGSFATGHTGLDHVLESNFQNGIPPCPLRTPLPRNTDFTARLPSGEWEMNMKVVDLWGGSSRTKEFCEWSRAIGFNVNEIMEKNGQLGANCGYIAAKCAHQLLNLLPFGPEWMNSRVQDEARTSVVIEEANRFFSQTYTANGITPLDSNWKPHHAHSDARYLSGTEVSTLLAHMMGWLTGADDARSQMYENPAWETLLKKVAGDVIAATTDGRFESGFDLGTRRDGDINGDHGFVSSECRRVCIANDTCEHGEGTGRHWFTVAYTIRRKVNVPSPLPSRSPLPSPPPPPPPPPRRKRGREETNKKEEDDAAAIARRRAPLTAAQMERVVTATNHTPGPTVVTNKANVHLSSSCVHVCSRGSQTCTEVYATSKTHRHGLARVRV